MSWTQFFVVEILTWSGFVLWVLASPPGLAGLRRLCADLATAIRTALARFGGVP